MTLVAKQITLGTDDCREEDDSTVSLTYQYVYVGRAPNSVVYDMGLRWQSVNIPPKAAILSAKLSLYLKSGVGSLLANIRGIAEDNPSTWSSGNRPSQLSKTTASVTANMADWNDWGLNSWIHVDISDIIQEIVNRDTWSTNNALAIVIEDAGSAVATYIAVGAYEYSGNIYGAKLDVMFTPSTQRSLDLDDGLVLYLPFNDGSGTSARDDSGCGNTGTLQNMGDTNWVTGKSGDAIDLNGSNEYVDCGNDTSLQITTQSISAWIKTSVTDTYIYASQNDFVGGGNLWINNHKLQFVLNLTTSTAASTTITDDVWHHVCVTFDDVTNTVNYYVDGDSDGATTNAAAFVHGVDKFVGFRVSGNVGHYFNGLIDELRVYDRVLTQTEITWLYKHPSGTLTDHPSGRACFTDLAGDGHTISDMISLDVSSELSDSADSFSLELLNTGDRYSWLERGCEIEIGIGMSGVNTQKLTGVVLDVERHLDSDDYPFMSVSGEDWGFKLNHLFFSGRFYDLELSVLLKEVLDSSDYSSGKTWQELAELSSDYSHIDPTAFSVDVASYKWKSLSEMIKELADSAKYDWYVDSEKMVHFFDAGATAISATITDSDLVAPPSLTDEGDIVNRAIVVGGYDQRDDQEVAGQTATTTVKSDVSANEKFTPTQDYLSSVLIWTELVSGSSSGLTLSVQADSGGSPDGVNLPNGKVDVSLDAINDGDYTEFRFSGHVTLTPSKDYHLVIYGTTTGAGEGQLLGTDGSNVIYVTRWPSRVAILAEDIASQSRYGMTMCTPYTDDKLEDPDLVELMANNMLVLESKTVASLERHGSDIDSGDVVKLTLTTPGIAVDKTMKVLSSSWSIGERFINNSLELKEI